MADFTGKRVALYVRVSTLLEDQRTSIETQRKQEELIKLEGGIIDDSLVYEDIGISGAKTARPGLDRLRIDAEAHKFDVIYTKNLSRLMRNTRGLLNFVEEMNDLGIVICFAEERIRTDESLGKLLLTVLGAVADLERENISGHIKTGYAIRRAAGKPATPWQVPYGYKWVSKKNDPQGVGYVDINEDEALVVRKIFDLFVNKGMSCQTICNNLFEEGIYTRRKGSAFERSTIDFILRNPRYIGTVIEKDSVPLEGAIPAIVERETWEAAQDLINKRKKTARDTSENFKPSKYPLSGVVKCGKCLCGCTRYGKATKNTDFEHLVDDVNGQSRFWGCISLSRRKLFKQCGAVPIGEYWIYKALIQVVVDLLVTDKLEAAVIPEELPYEIRLAQYEKQKKDLDKQKERIFNLYKRGKIDDAKYDAEELKIEEALAQLVKPEAKPKRLTARNLPTDVKAFINKYKEFDEYISMVKSVGQEVDVAAIHKQQETIKRGLANRIQIDWRNIEVKRDYVNMVVESIELNDHEVTIYTQQGPVYQTVVPQRSPAHYKTGPRKGHIIPHPLKVEKIADKHKKRTYKAKPDLQKPGKIE